MDHTPETARKWANEMGFFTTQVVENILANAQAERQEVKAVFTLKKSLRHYTKYELAKACQ
ncbi:hypothetical protein TEHAL1_20410 [Tetragenococcus halophilus]|uniref:hypothetical protein n=1 Tax=Tetragenococcus halophilus TaxID=51669 RepID=UPI000CCABA46|nr:hypothetical protein [Tetragenococcus halophilus]GBD80656.1 hypothetical protein TEHD10_1719 [Tetragenococcus halophilus subsp. halophilus]GFK21220.1 hypothetical protein WJ7_06830 [Tetragenococcus halophilus]GMA06961.1 hypothetical protein GCM10025886_01120 [Tetragenococcus halophilus subsp. flandriensis]GMG64566.1 hypothetical protein TEHAL1_20410 [Tetragenococcus halophilus]